MSVAIIEHNKNWNVCRNIGWCPEQVSSLYLSVPLKPGKQGLGLVSVQITDFKECPGRQARVENKTLCKWHQFTSVLLPPECVHEVTMSQTDLEKNFSFYVMLLYGIITSYYIKISVKTDTEPIGITFPVQRWIYSKFFTSVLYVSWNSEQLQPLPETLRQPSYFYKI